MINSVSGFQKSDQSLLSQIKLHASCQIHFHPYAKSQTVVKHDSDYLLNSSELH